MGVAQSLENTTRFLSDIHGRNLKIDSTGLVAYREVKGPNGRSRPTTNAYAFLNRPVEYGRRSFCLQVVSIDQNQSEQNMTLSIGCANIF